MTPAQVAAVSALLQQLPAIDPVAGTTDHGWSVTVRPCDECAADVLVATRAADTAQSVFDWPLGTPAVAHACGGHP